MSFEKLKVISKGWGFEKLIVDNEKYCGKLLYLIKGHRCSWHYHKNKEETLYIQKGKIILYHSTTNIDPVRANKVVLCPSDHFHIPINLKHQIYALEDTEIIEFSNENNDDDIYRIEKGD